jgi:ribosomal protein S18 acetylase RimI-like enzyme
MDRTQAKISVSIQEMTLDDYEEVYSLWKASEGLELSVVDSKESIIRFLERNPGLSFVARDENLIVGAVLCGHDGRRGYIDQLAVKKSHRLQGIGRNLVARCLYKLIHTGIRRWHLFVLEDNDEALAFWNRLGWSKRIELVTMSQSLPNAAQD